METAFTTPLSPALTLRPQQLAQGEVRTEAAAKDFEAMFISEMMSHMFSGLETDPVFGGGEGEEMFRSLLVQEYGKQMASNKGIGLSGELQKMMIQMQEMKG
jgi:flagellar protein FlgJ